MPCILNLGDPKEEMLEEKLFPLFTSEKIENYYEIFSKLQVIIFIIRKCAKNFVKYFFFCLLLKTEFLSKEDSNRVESSKTYLRALVASLCRSCLDLNRKKFDINIFLKRFTILKKFVNSNPVYEIEVLKSAQALDHKLKHMPGFILI